MYNIATLLTSIKLFEKVLKTNTEGMANVNHF